MSPSITPASPRIERLPAVLARVGLGRSSLYAAVAAGTFPRPIALTAHARGWVADEVDIWIAARVAARG